MAGKGGGAWKVAYADFVTAMMAFFMVMWLVGQKDEVKQAIAEHFSSGDSELDPDADAAGGPMTGHGRFGKRKGDAAKIPSPSESPEDPTARVPRILTLHDTLRTDVGAVVLFEADSVDLNETAKKMLREILPKLEGKPHKIEVRGHCSGRPLQQGHALENGWQLSYARSMAVLDYLQELGIPPVRVRLSQAANYEPFTLQEDVSKQVRNERVEVYLLNELTTELQGTKQEREKRYEQQATAPVQE
jgi:chemotaxis protein MotB